MNAFFSVLALVVLPLCLACDSNLSGLSGTFTSPNYPSNYPDGKTCTTTITAPTGKIIKLKFTDFDLEEASGCSFDSVEIKDGAIAKKYCGKQIPPEYVSKGNIITVKFVSDVITNGKGFSASYVVSDPPPPLPPATVNAKNCGTTKVAQSRIVGGKNATKGAWPWQVGLFSVYGSLFCGGSLIAPNWVVTAAHCIDRSKPTEIKIRVGELDTNVNEGTEQKVDVEKVIPHPRYHVGKGADDCVYHKLNNDVGLLKLERPVMLNDHVNTVCLPPQGQNVPVGKLCYVTGWGKIKPTGGVHHMLQQAYMPIVDSTICQTKLTASDPFMKLSNQMVCAGKEGSNQDSCQGDSGGPLVCLDVASNKYILQGDVSWGSGSCNIDEIFGVYGRMSEFRQWIDDTLKAN